MSISSQIALLLVFSICSSMAYIVMMDTSLAKLNENELDTIMELEPILENPEPFLIRLSDHVEQVCKSRIRSNLRPHFGSLKNGSRVEFQQDERNEFVATVIDCIPKQRNCHGIDHKRYISECATVFEERQAFVRLIDTHGNYVQATVRVPIACECRISKFGNIPVVRRR